MKKILLVVALLLFLAVVIYFSFTKKSSNSTLNINRNIKTLQTVTKANPNISSPLSIETLRRKSYPGSSLQIEQTLEPGSNYSQNIVSYLSDGLKIYGLLTVPFGSKPKNGWPIIIFNHGYIAPKTYETNPQIGQYATYLPVFAENGYIVFKPDYRGNGKSEGQPEGAYYSPAYMTDDLNAIASIKKYKDPSAGSGQLADPHLIGIWGHSMGGNITLRDLVVDPKDIKAAVIWSGVVGTYTDLLNWHDPAYQPSAYELSLRNRHRSELVNKYGTPEKNPAYWNAIDPANFVNDITAPVQLHVGEADEEVPPTFSEHLFNELKKSHKTAEFYTYPGANHNISQDFDLAMQRSLAFFDKYLKSSK